MHARLRAPGIKPLVACLCSKAVLAVEQASAALAKLAKVGTDEVRLMIARAGAIQPLVQLLDGREANGSELAQQDAAAALAELSLVPTNKIAIDRAGGSGLA